MLSNAGTEGLLKKLVNPNQNILSNQPSDKEALRVLARVVDIKAGKVVLSSPKGKLTGKIETPVYRGEQLLLEFSGIKEGRVNFSILARTGATADLTEATPENRYPSWWSLLVNAGMQLPEYPVLIRYIPVNREQKKSNYNSSDASSSVMELIIDTGNLGLIMIRIEFNQQKMHCSFLVEDQEAGKALEVEARKMLQKTQGNKHTSEKLLEWKVFPVREELARNAPEGLFTFDQKA